MKKKDVYNLTNPQKSIWYTEQVFNGSTVNNICCTGIIYEPIDVELFKKALNILVKQNDSFRIHITLNNGDVKQYISDYKPFDIETQYIKNEAELESIEKEQADYKFDILDGNLYTLKLVILKNKFTAIILTANHIISDSWSVGVSVKEALEIYHSLAKNEELPQNTYSYIDYINSENEYIKSSKHENDQKYWKGTFNTIPEQATIPGSNLKTKQNSNDAIRLSFDIQKNAVDKINNFCAENKISAFNFFMAIYSIYIGHVSNSSDFVIGTPIINRTNFKDKHTTGMFVNTVPLRVNRLNETTFKELASNVAKKTREVLRHQKYSYNSILEDLRQVNGNIPNLYNIMISYQITKTFDKDYGDYTTRWVFNNACANDIDIHIYDLNDTGNLVVSYDFLKEKYTKEDIQSVHARVMNIIYQVLQNCDIYTNDIEITTEDEKLQLIHKFNNTNEQYPTHKTIVNLFEEQVEKTPESTALIFDNNHLSYKELNNKINQLSNYLKSINIKENDKVAILLNNSFNLVISILAVLKLGACYIPISPKYPENRIKDILEDSNCNLLITNNTNKNRFAKCLYLDDINDLSNYDKSNLSNKIDPNQLAYIIYTSGSTGKPKGVSIAHSSLLNYIYWANEFYCNKKATNFPLYSSIGFDLTVTSVFTPLICGGSIIIYKEDDIFSTLKDIFEKSSSDVVKLTPAHLSLINEFKFSKTNVKTLILGGDLLFPDVCKKITNKFKDITIYNEYGPTEATVGCMIYKYCEASNKYSSVPIGKPIANTQIYVLDNMLKPVPINCSGELYISGRGLSKGYINNTALTNKSFVKNPFAQDALMYKTGDLALHTQEDGIICLGRIDNQVKIRGLRIELGEIENKLNDLPYINSCVVINREHSQLHSYLCAYFTSNITVNIENIKAHLEKFLPRYMVPNYYVQLKTLPYNNNGKIDKKQLPEPEQNRAEIVLPRNNFDSKLIDILKQLLHADTISINDNFFDIGGDSLSAITLGIHIEDKFNIKILVNDIFSHPIIKDLSDFIKSKDIGCDTQIITPVQKADSYATSAAQKRIYFASQVDESKSTLYNTPGGIIVQGRFDEYKLAQCFTSLVQRHEALRTSFELNNNNMLVQKIDSSVDFKLNIINAAKYEELDLLFKEFVKPFDLSKAPLFRAQLINFENNKSALFIDMHHIISDGKSLNIFIDEFCKLYNDFTLPELNTTYKDYANFENNRLTTGELKEAEHFWLKQLDNISNLNMPTTFSRPAVQNFEGSKVYASINKNINSRIAVFCKTLGITPYMFLLSCYYILLSKYTSQDDIIVGSPIAGRNILNTDNIIGVFINTLALRSQIDLNSTFKEFLSYIKEKTLNAYKYQDYPFNELINKLNIKRDPSRNPLFDTMFIYQNDGYKPINLKRIRCPNIFARFKCIKV